MPDWTSYTVEIENFLMVTHAVPVERIRPRVPSELKLSTVKGPEGEDFALVSATCFLNHDLKWSPGGEETLDFHQSIFRTYVECDGNGGSYIIGNFIERATPLVFERLAMKHAYAADFDVSLSYDPNKRSYGHYYCEILSSKGDTIIEIVSEGKTPTESTPFKSSEDMVRFITACSNNYFTMLGGKIGVMETEFGEMNPVGAELLAAEFGYWESLGIAWEEEFEQPYSVLVQPSVKMTLHAPKPIG